MRDGDDRSAVDAKKMLRYQAASLAQRIGIPFDEAVQRIETHRLQSKEKRELGRTQLQRVHVKKKRRLKGKDHAPQYLYGMSGPPLAGGAPGLGKKR